MKHRIGIDLGGTKIEGVILDADGREIIRKRIATESERGYQHILDRIKLIHDELAATVAGQPTTFGIGTPGAWVTGALPAVLAPLATLGRWSLSFYMLHQPVLFGVLAGATALRH